MMWLDKRYHSLNYHLRSTFHEKLVKLSFDNGFTCPNRDGSKGTGGCIFCSNRGSGDFTPDKTKSIQIQYEQAKLLIDSKWPNKKYIAYFQAFSNTYASIDILEKKYREVLEIDDVLALSIGTRPDCIEESHAKLISDLHLEYNKPIDVELGLQTSNPKTQELLNLKYNNEDFVNACSILNQYHIPIISHVIIGLPYETKSDVLNTVRFAVSKHNHISGIKLHMLHILKNTALEKLYESDQFKILSFDEYIDILISCLRIIPPHIVIHRLTGDAPKNQLIAPLWSSNKKQIFNRIDRVLKEENLYQGIDS